MQKIIPNLWFDNQAEDAAKFYASTFKNSKVGKIAKYSESGAKVSGQKKGSVMTVEFEIDGFQFVALNGGPEFKITPAISFFVNCETEKEIDVLWGKLSKGGQVMMELDKYDWSPKYGWVQDKFGVSWQVALGKADQKIIPAFLFTGKGVGKTEEAINFYTSLLKNSKIKAIHKDPHTNTVIYSSFTLAGEYFSAMESALDHKFGFTHGVSLMINCKTQDEVDEFYEKLSKGGEKEPCGWVKDKYGVSWQVVPTILNELISDKDPKKAEKVMAAMLKMKKLDIDGLKQAYK
jgi:predicted 3-demethylubiquinone-9 3-methyltransferase (glyoxalase superfamily)